MSDSNIGWLPPLYNPHRPSQTTVEIHQFIPNDSHQSRPSPVLYLTLAVDFESDSQDTSTRQKRFPGLLNQDFILRQALHKGSVDIAETACLPAIKSDENRITLSRKHLYEEEFSSPEPCSGHELFYKINKFLVDAFRNCYVINRSHSGHKFFFWLKIGMVITVPDDELKSWHSWFDAKEASDPNFSIEFQRALSRPRTKKELFGADHVQTTGKSCSICLDDFSDDSKVLKLVCGHVFHKTCILKWLKIKPGCPYCRFEIKR